MLLNFINVKLNNGQNYFPAIETRTVTASEGKIVEDLGEIFWHQRTVPHFDWSVDTHFIQRYQPKHLSYVHFSVLINLINSKLLHYTLTFLKNMKESKPNRMHHHLH